MTPKSIEDFFEKYAAAFSQGDVEKISGLWKLPAFISARDQSAYLTDAQAFRKNTEALIAFYAEQGLARARKTVVSIDELCEDLAVVTTWDECFDASDHIITQWRHAYLVRETSAGIRAIAAVADSELNAWSARGTPLCSRDSPK